MLQAISQMIGTVGYDAVIVCTSNIAQEKYWQKRLEATRGQAAREGAVILAVHEDWGPDGAGNGLGTLYAYTKARAKAKASFSIDLDEKMRTGWSVAMFHTAGKGTRLAPLPGSENNNKPGVKLPAILHVDGKSEELTILEAVIRQTNSYAPHRKGRCSVFWGDQVFVPSAGTPESGSHPADILACLGPMPSEAEWTEKGLDKYGLIAVNGDGDAAQVEKVSFAMANKLLSTFGKIKEVGPSLGSFSLSAALLFALLEEYGAEIKAKEAKFDSDPHFWMPMTLAEEAYVSVMESKGVASADATAHYKRMATFKDTFTKENKCGGMLGCINAGTNCYWWDYGQLKLYQKNNLLVTKDSAEADALRQFLGMADRKAGSTIEATKDDASVILSSTIKAGSVKDSLCTRVTVNSLEAEGSILVNVCAKKVVAKNCILYNVIDDSEDGIVMPDGGVRADVFMPGHDKVVIKSTMETDGGKAWKVCVEGNSKSFEDVYKANGSVDIIEAQAMSAGAKEKVLAAL